MSTIRPIPRARAAVGQPRQPLWAAQRRRDGGGIGDIVAVGGTLDGGQDRRQVQMRHPEIIEVIQHVQGVGEGEAVTAHLQPIRRQRKSHVSGGLTQYQQRPRLQRDLFACSDDQLGRACCVGRVQRRGPLLGVVPLRGDEVLRFVIRVEAQQERIVDNPFAARIGRRDRLAVEEDRHALAKPGAPILGSHLLAGGRQPGDVAGLIAGADGLALEETAPAEDGMVPPQLGDPAGELVQVGVRLPQGPVHPGDLGVLAVDVVVAPLGAPDLVAVRDHRGALRDHQRAHDVAHLLGAQRQDIRVVGRALHPAVPRPVVAFAVAVVLAVGLVVLLVVRHQVGQREAVVTGDEVDARAWPPPGGFVEVRGPGQPRGEFAEGRGFAPPVVAHNVAILPVPFGPQTWKVADLITALADVPRLGDQLDLADHRILLHQIEEGRQPVDVVELPGQRGGQVEAEAVDMHFQHPVPQRVHDQLQRVRVPRVETVAGAGEVLVDPQVAVLQAVVGGVVDAAEVDRRTEVVAFGRVVVDDVENDLDPGLVKRPHHGLELGHRAAGVSVGGILVVRREEAKRVVAPVVSQTQVDQSVVVQELVHGH